MGKRGLTPFGLIVNKRLVELNMTQRKLAEKIGTSEAYLSMILRGERAGKKYLEDIVKILNIDMKSIKNII